MKLNLLLVLTATFLVVPIQSGFSQDTEVGKTSDELGQPADSDFFEIKSAILQIVESRDIPAEVSGIVRSVAKGEGEIVSSHQVIATIDDREAQIQLAEAKLESQIARERMASELEIEFAKKSREVAEADYQRAIASNEKFFGVVSETEMDRLRLVVEKNDAELKQIIFEKKLLELTAQLKDANVDRKELELGKMAIRSPMAGKIISVSKREGEWVEKSETVFKVVRLNPLRVEDYLPAVIATNDLLNTEAEFELKNDESATRYQGKVVFIDPEVNPINSRVRVWVEINNPNFDLRPGMTGSLKINLPAAGHEQR